MPLTTRNTNSRPRLRTVRASTTSISKTNRAPPEEADKTQRKKTTHRTQKDTAISTSTENIENSGSDETQIDTQPPGLIDLTHSVPSPFSKPLMLPEGRKYRIFGALKTSAKDRRYKATKSDNYYVVGAIIEPR